VASKCAWIRKEAKRSSAGLQIQNSLYRHFSELN